MIPRSQPNNCSHLHSGSEATQATSSISWNGFLVKCFSQRVIMAVELAIMSAVIAAIKQYKPKWNERVILVPTLILGRIVNIGLIYLFAGFIDLPAGFVAGASFISAWPGIILIPTVVPPLVRLATRQKVVLGPQGEDK